MHFENMGVKLFVPGTETKPVYKNKEYLAPARMTKHNMTKWIKNAALDDHTKKELLAKIAKYPADTMHHFFANIHEHIRRIQANRPQKSSE